MVACPEAVTVYNTKVVKDTGILGICMCTEYEPSLVILKAKEYREQSMKLNSMSQELRDVLKTKTKTKTWN